MTLFLYYNGSAVRSEGLKEIQVNLIYIGVLQSKVTSNLVSPSIDYFLQKPYVPENAIKYFFFSKQLFNSLQCLLYLFLQNILQEMELKLKQPKDVRWLSHDAATKALYRSLRSVLVHLNQEMGKGVVMARALWSWLRTYKAIATLYLLCDVLPHLSALSKCFQQKQLDLTEIHRAVETKKQVIRLARDQPIEGGRLANLDVDLSPGGRLDGLEIQVFDQQRQEFASVQRQFIDNLVENMEERFPQTELLAAFGVLDPGCLPNSMTGDYGWEEMNQLSTFYSDGHSPIDREELRDEWISFRQHLGSYRQKTPKVMCQVLSANPTLACQYPNIASLYARMVVIPVHTADCERAFSTLKRVKTRLRSTMTNATLNHLLRISIEGPAIDKAVSRWGSLRNRRLLL
ncbi:uncharacterized protein LOC130385760 isoform X1 [Gadus chalcogrammus]|uniref:uncharacterized protein LOC130385760 isoform X1 n=1 Tax=Gadus chalcogrammus TaxID=1042646 RepID=UPI0024C39459|nr:uncharacterized protein LOC130385760 isoform X1 [Gadus chalcogrammus]XP_056450415.1 uncharacterized protein LOC130385760 isoform X1 [Gadus chalcogrammus]XP_056450416.1 uncharacterized protein LOC130385760 isoform X1 [Gadus chalcogrammus]XP_056450417.1 uncharacterized protein LOC130385760 isoform X1 [Gadus chalcogrammus]